MDFSRYEKLRTLVRANFSEQTQRLVDEALEYAGGKLAGLVRYDGSPLLDHAVAVASIVISEVGLGRNSSVASILHDVVRLAHKQLPAEEFLALSADIRKRFGDQVMGITLGLANISELKLKVAKEQADNFRDLIVSYSEDPRVILIKLADRLEVMRSLEMFPREKWRKKSWESMNLYAQIAHKLGLYSIKSELEDIALKYLEPKDYEHIVTKLEESAEERRAFIARFLVPIEQRLAPPRHQIPCQKPHQVDLFDLEQDAQTARPVRRRLRHLRHPHHHRLRTRRPKNSCAGRPIRW